nr:MAG TPA: hypothetical protein [Caudoviricetes sp.]
MSYMCLKKTFLTIITSSDSRIVPRLIITCRCS